ncbi:uncharacterized protein LOC111340016 [Stylophora pistillata]|uniref:uncharacterized protein LOC111340016 n=1 Tax=Stylophora pistillata TaxID=50429 RepID=UPI000C0533A0|nr:uncharacterized protein LOC111340016 [Stylophora pistillata]
MNVQKGYCHVSTTKLGRNVPTKTVNNNFSPSMSGVFAKCSLGSSAPRAAYTKSSVQPKIMSPMTNHSSRDQRRKYVSSLSIIPKEKIPKIVVLPSIDKDIAVTSAKPVSARVPGVTTAPGKKRSQAPKSEKGSFSQANYISCLHTSLSTEWRKATSLDRENSEDKERQPRRTSSLEIKFSYSSKNTSRSAPTTRSSSDEIRDEEKNTSLIGNQPRGENKSVGLFNRNMVKEVTAMSKDNVRVQYTPLRKSFTIKNVVTDGNRRGTSANAVLSTRCQDFEQQRTRTRMLPKSRFRVKIQKCRHKSVNISDSFNIVRDKRAKPLEKASRSVIIQDKSPQRSFSIQKSKAF